MKKVEGKAKLELLLELSKRYRSGYHNKVVEYATLALTLARELEDSRSESRALGLISGGNLALIKFNDALEYGREAISAARRSRDKPYSAQLFEHMGSIYIELDSMDKALNYSLWSMKIWEELGDGVQFAYGLINIGVVYARFKKHRESADYYLKALAAFKAVNDRTGIALSLNNIGGAYNGTGDFEKALKYMDLAVDAFKEAGYQLRAARAYMGIGHIRLRQKEFHRALEDFYKALKLSEKIRDIQGIVAAYIYISRCLLEVKKYTESIAAIKKALPIAIRAGYGRHTIDLLVGLAKLYSILKNDEEGIKYLSQALKVAEKNDLKSLGTIILEAFFKTYARMGNYELAYNYYHGNVVLETTIREMLSIGEVRQLKLIKEKKKKEKEIEILEKDNQIRELNLERTTITRNIFIVGFILVSAILGLLVHKYLYLMAFWKKEKYMGRYRLLEKIGSGAMGTVYKARSVVDKTQLAAVKVLKEELQDNEKIKKRFLREGVIIDKLEHPNIIRIIERGEYKHRFFTAMELLEGETLEARLEKAGQLPVSTTIQIAAQIAEALAVIHQKNIIHRDLKPDNVMLLRTNGNRDTVKLLDFGLARMEIQTRLTESGNFIGTLQYISPEQILNSDSTTKNDIFSMGVMTYRMLTGESPFPGETAIEVMRRIVGTEPPPLSGSVGSIPGRLSLMVMKMVSKDPDQRPSAESVRRTFEEVSSS
ncbi:MAG: protein kinase [bacterium]|nr:protein kinase [bacterium]